MGRIAYVNGAYRALRDPLIAVEDRGFQFGDAVYEVWAVRGGRLFDCEAHFARLTRSLREIRMDMPTSDAALLAVLKETLRRNRVRDGLVYLQISRGVSGRDHGFPAKPVKPTIVVTAKTLDPAVFEARAAAGVKVVTLPDERWARCDIKSVNLLPNTLAKQKAREAGAYEAWLVDDEGYVTEGTSSNAWLVDGEGVLVTRPLSHALLPGVTRNAVIKLAQDRQMRVEERAFTPAEAQAAQEAFLTSAANAVMPIVSIDGKGVNGGKPGPVATALRQAYFGADASADAMKAAGIVRMLPGAYSGSQPRTRRG